MSAASQHLHLIIDSQQSQRESNIESPSGFDDSPPYDTLAVPTGISYLLRRRGDQRPTITDKKPRGRTQYLVLELAPRGPVMSLLALNPTDLPVRVNGVQAPVVAVLGEKDQLQLGCDPILHVTSYDQPYLGPAPDPVVGKACPVCSVPIAKGTTVYLCPRCPAAMHCEGDEKKEQERLECARLASHCPVCTGPVVFREGFTYEPELYHG